jgi:hypothetical protein
MTFLSMTLVSMTLVSMTFLSMTIVSMTFVAHALLRAVLALVPTPLWELHARSHECERSTHECVRHSFLYQRY